MVIGSLRVVGYRSMAGKLVDWVIVFKGFELLVFKQAIKLN